MNGRGSQFAKEGANRVELDSAEGERLADAEALFDAGRYPASVAMGPYAVEIRLKILICHRLDLESLPKPLETHDLEGLLILAGLSAKINRLKRPQDVRGNWFEVLRLSRDLEGLRYSSKPEWDHAWASTALNRISKPPSGVLPWLSTQMLRRRP